MRTPTDEVWPEPQRLVDSYLEGMYADPSLQIQPAGSRAAATWDQTSSMKCAGQIERYLGLLGVPWEVLEDPEEPSVIGWQLTTDIGSMMVLIDEENGDVLLAAVLCHLVGNAFNDSGMLLELLRWNLDRPGPARIGFDVETETLQILARVSYQALSQDAIGLAAMDEAIASVADRQVIWVTWSGSRR